MKNNRFATTAAPASEGSSSQTVTAFQLTLIPPVPGFSFVAREFIDATHRDAALRFRGSCRGVCTDDRVVAEMRAPAEIVRVYLDALVKCTQKTLPNGAVTLTIEENPRQTLTPAEEAFASSLDTSPVRLTCGVFMTLPAGVFVASNVLSSGGSPAFAELVADQHERNGQWARVKSAGADQRLCRTFPTETAYREWASAIAQFFNRNAASS